MNYDAITWNKMIINSISSKPHEKDIARMRLRILKRKKKEAKHGKKQNISW